MKLKHLLASLRSKENIKAYDLTFVDYWFQQSLSYLRPTLIVTIALTFMFYPVDGVLLNAHAANYLQNARVYFMAPAIGIFLLLSYTRINPNLYFFGLSLLYLIGGVLFGHAMSLNGTVSSLYGFIGVAHALVLLMIPSRIPATFSIPFGLALLIINLSTVYGFDPNPENDKLMYSIGLVTFSAILCLSAIVRDLNAYRNYHALKSATQLTQDQGLWASMIARVLKHELGNLLTGITSSIEMMQLIDNQHKDNSALTAAVNRNLATVSSFRELLTRISEYANVDIEQTAKRLYQFSLSEALDKAMFNFESRRPNVAISRTGSTKDIEIHGDTLLFTLALENLFEYSYTTIDRGENENVKIELRLNKRTIELHSHLENSNENSENTTNDARHFQAKLSTTTNSAAVSEQHLSRTSESAPRLSPFEEKNPTIPRSQSMTGEEFVLQIAKHILALHLATIDEEDNTNTSMVFRIVFKTLQLKS